MLLFAILLTWASFIPSIEAYLLGEVTQSYTRTPLYLLMFSIPIGGMLLILEILRELFEMFQRRGMKDMEEGEAPLL
jgi:TRAP-type C4-dicarboxylate transport system permease small subunit